MAEAEKSHEMKTKTSQVDKLLGQKEKTRGMDAKMKNKQHHIFFSCVNAENSFC